MPVELPPKIKIFISEALANSRLPVSSHKIIIAGLTPEWISQTEAWASDFFTKKLNLAPGKIPYIAIVGQNSGWAFTRYCDHPNALVILEVEDNCDAIKDFLERQEGKVLH